MSRGNNQKTKLRIAMLGHKRIPSREGGVEIVVAELATRMAERGHGVTCYNRRGAHVSGAEHDASAKNIKEYNGVRIKRVLTINKKGLAAMSASFFASVRAAFGKYDVVHFHAEGPCAMLWLPRLFGKRCIATVHGLDHQRAKWGRFASWYIKSGEKCAVKYADEIIVLSESVRDYFKEVYGRETLVIPNGVSKSEQMDALEISQKHGLEKDGYILFLARLVPEKGIKRLIEAYGRVNTEKRLVIAGGSSDTADFEAELFELARNDGRILFTGFVQGRELSELYSNAYFYVLPSDLEGMPLSLLEAMSYGNCCLVSDIPECASVIEDRGFTFKAGDIDDLKEKLQMLCDNAGLVEDMKKTAAEYICGKYDWNEVTDRTLAVYKNKEK